MYGHLSPEQRERLRVLERKTVHVMSSDERIEYQALIAPRGVETIIPEGQQVIEPYDGKPPDADWVSGDGSRYPYIGLWVTYYSRPGEGRNAKTRFPAMVTDVYGLDPRAKRWKVKLMVVWNAVETTDVICLERCEEDRYGTWAYVDDPMWQLLSKLSNDLKAIEQRLNGNGRPSPPRPK